MNEFMNWHDSWILVQHNWVWMLVAAGIGVFIGWRSFDTTPDTKR